MIKAENAIVGPSNRIPAIRPERTAALQTPIQTKTDQASGSTEIMANNNHKGARCPTGLNFVGHFPYNRLKTNAYSGGMVGPVGLEPTTKAL